MYRGLLIYRWVKSILVVWVLAWFMNTKHKGIHKKIEWINEPQKIKLSYFLLLFLAVIIPMLTLLQDSQEAIEYS